MSMGNTIRVWIFLLVSSAAWSNVLVHWTNFALPPTKELGLNDVVLSWSDSVSPQVKAARKQGYRVYVEASLQQAAAAAKAGGSGVEGIILTARQSERAELQKALPKLRADYPKLKFLVLNSDGKPPQMRGSLVIKRGSVLEVSSPTAQPWIDTNLALVKVEQRAHQGQLPMYTFSWAGLSDSGHPPALTADDFSLALAEAGAFHADLILELDEHLQKGLTEHNPEAWALWNPVRLYATFYSRSGEPGLEAAANVAIVVDDFDTSDETMNLLARHNIPYKILVPADLKSGVLDNIELAVMLAKPDSAACERLADLAAHGKTVVVVDAHGSYPWQNDHPLRLNEHAVSYAVGNGKVLELSEPITDPETFAQDIRRLLGTQNALISLWNGLTTIAVPYREHGKGMKVLELINYAGDPLRLQVQVKGSFSSVRFETPGNPCCKSLVPVKHDGFTEFVIPDLGIAGRLHLEAEPQPVSPASRE